jgi:hypothetical protein
LPAVGWAIALAKYRAGDEGGRPTETRNAASIRTSVATRVLQRLLALTAAIWHNHHCDVGSVASLVAYDHP